MSANMRRVQVQLAVSVGEGAGKLAQQVAELETESQLASATGCALPKHFPVLTWLIWNRNSLPIFYR